MNFSEFANKIHPNLAGISNQGQFVGGLFNAAGDTHFPLNPSYDTYDLQKKMVNGTRKITPKMKNRFPNPIDMEGLHKFFSKRIGETTLPIIMRNFGIPESEPENKEFFIRALCTQFQNIITEASDEVDDIVASEYLRLLRESGSEIKTDVPYYPGDDFEIIDQQPKRKHEVNFYKDFVHQWTLRNTGSVTWEGRYLEFVNQSDLPIRASSKTIDIPKVKPGEEVSLAVEMNARSCEGDFEAIWEMKDSEGRSCFTKNQVLMMEVIVGW